MPLSTGATWPALRENFTAAAADMTSKFEWLEGHRYPMQGGSLTTGIFDIGNATYEWNNAYINNIHFSSCSFPVVNDDKFIRAWANATMAGGTTTVNQSFNVSSFLQAGVTGTVTINIDRVTSGFNIIKYVSINTSAIITNSDFTARRIVTYDASGSPVDTSFCVLVTGPLNLEI